jgi:hypothetical protein
MKCVIFLGVLAVSASALAQAQSPKTPPTNGPLTPGQFVQPGAPSNPWDIVPPTAPYRNLAEAIKATQVSGQASPLNPSCEGKTGAECARSAAPPKR